MCKQTKNASILSFFPIFFRLKQETSSSKANQNTLSHHPTSNNAQAWRDYWIEQGLLWRTEPEIDLQRQKQLDECRNIVPDITKGVYPFKGMKLSRADVEWLLVTHEHGRGPVNWQEESQRHRKGLDLRGANLNYVNLIDLPLARIRGGLILQEWDIATAAQRRQAAVLLKHAHLGWAHLEGAFLRKADLEGAILFRTILERTHFEEANLQGASLVEANLEKTRLMNVQWSDEKRLGPYIVDIQWGNSNLAVVPWFQIQMLGEENEARQKRHGGQIKSRERRLEEYEKAVRAYRQLSVALQQQGLNEEAMRFAYRAQVLQREVLWKQRFLGKWFFSFLLALVAGYGYHMWRILACYVLVISVCACAYFVLGMYYPPHLSLLQAFLESITAFHGRVFFELFTSDTPQIWVTAAEAVLGLLIEGVFIAMLTQRFFGK